MRLTTRLLVLALGVAPFLGAVIGYRLHGSPAPSPSVHAAQQTVRADTKLVARVDTVYRRDSAHNVRWATHWDTARVTDTVTHDSIVYVRLDVADSTVHACRAVVSSCARSIAARDTLITALHAEIAARSADHPSRLRTLTTYGLLVTGGYLAGRAGVSVHLPFSVRLP